MRTSHAQILAISCAVMLFATPLLAQKSAKSSESQESERPKIPTDARRGTVLRLKLADCLRLAAIQNVDLKIGQLVQLAAREDIRASKGAFDVEFFLDGSWARRQSPKRNDFQPGSVTKTYAATLGLRKKVITGATVELSYGPTYTDQRVNSTFAFPQTIFTGDLKVSITQPLLRGAWMDYNGADIRKAAHEAKARTLDWESSKQGKLDAAASAYFDLVFAREDWIVKWSTLELARKQLKNTLSRIALGGLAPRDKVADEADVARKQEDLIQAENKILDAEDELRRLLMGFESDEDWNIILIPGDDLASDEPKLDLPAWKDAARIARTERPDIRAKERRLAAAELDVMKGKRDLLPKLDLKADYAADAQRDSYGDWNSDVIENRYPDYSVSVAFSFPLGNRVAEARERKARISRDQVATELEILRIDVTKDVRETIRQLETLQRSIAAARESVRLAQSNLEAELIKLKLDSTTQFEVQGRRNELSDARSRLIRARLDARKAWFHLLAVQGKIDAWSRFPKAERGSAEKR